MKNSVLLLLAVLALAATARAQQLSFDDKGLHIEGDGLGGFTLGYPEFTSDGQPGTHKIIASTPNGASATVEYEGGATLTASISPQHAVTYTFAHVPADVKSLRYELLIDFSYQQGGTWKMDDGKTTPFPIDKPAAPHLFQDHAAKFQLVNREGKALVFGFPPYSFLELQDNREWNWPIYEFVGHIPLDHANPVVAIAVGADATHLTTKPPPLVDEFGQITTADWLDKVKSLDELKSDVKNEADYYASLKVPALDPVGGLPGSGEKFGLHATGFFHVEKKDEKWMLVDPQGNLFFHLGLCGFSPGDDYTTIAGRHDTFAWLPPYEGEFKSAFRAENGSSVFSFHSANMIRKYGKPYTLPDFTSTMIDRVRKWGFNSIGAFSPVPQDVVHAKNFPYVLGLPLDEWSGGIKRIPGIRETWDPFDPALAAQVQKNFAKAIPPHADDPLLIGYFLTNEPIYEDIPKVVPGLKGSAWACKRELVRELEEKYGTVAAFNTAWAQSTASFDDLSDQPLAVTTQAAADDVHAFTGQFFEAYFKLVADTYHQYDTHHMLIGNRFQPGTINNEQLCRIAGKYLDVMSFNYYTDGVDKDFLNRIYAWTGRPMILSEFYWAASKQSGLAGGREVATQQQRGLAYRNYVEQSATLGYVVGIEWFTLIDQASTGRWFSGFSGERSNTGLFAVTDRPWKPAVAEMARTNDEIYDVLTGVRPAFAWDDPRFQQVGDLKKSTSAPHGTGPIALDGTTKNWPGIPPEVISGKHLVNGTDAGGVEGSFKLCWDEQNLYVLVTVIDPTPLQNQHKTPADFWDGDAVEIFLGPEKLDDGGPLLFSDRHIVINAGQSGDAPLFYANTAQQLGGRALLIPGGDAKSYTLEAAIPWKAIGLEPKPGAELRFDVAIDDSTNGKSRVRQLTWNGTDKNSGDRTHWGRLQLLP